MNWRTEKRYYELNELVYVKPEKKLGVIKELKIEPENKIYKAIVEMTRKEGEATIITTKTYDVWDLDKNKKTLYKEQNKKSPTILFAKVRDTATIPSKSEENAGYDIYANFEEDYIILHPNTVVLVPTGIASSVRDEWALIVKERGSTGSKGMGVRAGVVDSGYRGEIFVALNNTNKQTIIIVKKNVEVVVKEGTIVYPYEKAIAQLLLVSVPKARIKEIPFDELKAIPSTRGEGKLGSSDK